MADDDVYRFELRAKSVEELRSFLGGPDWDFGCRPAVRRDGDDYVVEVYAPTARMEAVRSLRPGTPISTNERTQNWDGKVIASASSYSASSFATARGSISGKTWPQRANSSRMIRSTNRMCVEPRSHR